MSIFHFFVEIPGPPAAPPNVVVVYAPPDADNDAPPDMEIDSDYYSDEDRLGH